MQITRSISTGNGGSKFVDFDIAMDDAVADAFRHLIHRSGVHPAQSAMLSGMPRV